MQQHSNVASFLSLSHPSPPPLPSPLPSPQLFFEGVEGLIAGGTKAEEVGYRLDYSRNELKKCSKEYPGKEVRV